MRYSRFPLQNLAFRGAGAEPPRRIRTLRESHLSRNSHRSRAPYAPINILYLSIVFYTSTCL